MLKKSAIIVSQSLKLSKQIECELLLLGYDVKTEQEILPQTLVDPDVLIYDATSVPLDSPIVFRAAYNIFIYSEKADLSSAHGFDKTLKYPFLLEEFHNMVASSQSFIPYDENEEQKNEKVILRNKKNNSVVFKNTVIDLSDNELRTLTLLCENSGKCVTRETLSAHLGAKDGNMADVYICHLRRKLENPFGVKIIYTVRAKGYTTDFILK